jgi:2-dehydropantoate 2-reductase
MKYAVLGAGAMGSLIGAALSKGGQEVLLVDPYREHMDRIAAEGLRLSFGPVTETVRMQTCTNPAEAGQVDVVVLLVKGFMSETAITGARGLFGEGTFVCTLQNGLGNVEVLEKHFPRDRILQGVIHLAGRMVGPGEVSGARYRETDLYLGSLVKEGPASDVAKTMAGSLSDGGLTAEYKTDVEGEIWKKAVVNACLNAPCGVLRLRGGEYFGHPEGKRIAADIAREFAAVAAAKGIVIDVDDAMRYLEAGTRTRSEHYPSMAQDMMNRRRTEIDFLNGAVVKYGQERGIPTPANDYVTRFVKIIEDNYDLQF